MCENKPGDSRDHRPNTRATRAGDQGQTPHRGGIGQGTQDSATKVKGQASHEEGEARSNVERIQDDTTTPQNHNHNAATNRRRQRRRREGGQMKKKQNKVKINSSEHHKSDYRRAEKEKKRIKKIKG